VGATVRSFSAAARATAEAVPFNCEPPGDLGVQPHHRHRTGLHREQLIVTVQV